MVKHLNVLELGLDGMIRRGKFLKSWTREAGPKIPPMDTITIQYYSEKAFLAISPITVRYLPVKLVLICLFTWAFEWKLLLYSGCYYFLMLFVAILIYFIVFIYCIVIVSKFWTSLWKIYMKCSLEVPWINKHLYISSFSWKHVCWVSSFFEYLHHENQYPNRKGNAQHGI